MHRRGARSVGRAKMDDADYGDGTRRGRTKTEHEDDARKRNTGREMDAFCATRDAYTGNDMLNAHKG